MRKHSSREIIEKKKVERLKQMVAYNYMRAQIDIDAHYSDSECYQISIFEIYIFLNRYQDRHGIIIIWMKLALSALRTKSISGKPKLLVVQKYEQKLVGCLYVCMYVSAVKNGRNATTALTHCSMKMSGICT